MVLNLGMMGWFFPSKEIPFKSVLDVIRNPLVRRMADRYYQLKNFLCKRQQKFYIIYIMRQICMSFSGVSPKDVPSLLSVIIVKGLNFYPYSNKSNL